VKIVTVGRGNVGGGLAALWRAAGHEVTELGRGGGDVSGADAVLLAVPAGAIADAIASLRGVKGIPVIDATNNIGGDPPEGYRSLAEYVRSLTEGPVGKAFNLNFARLLDRVAGAARRPSAIYAADEGAVDVTERLIRDAGYEPVSAGDLDAAATIEQAIGVVFAIAGERGPFFYRITAPDEL
jgi:8-hydroxy-5-deazaflavin:NADPH oxidoreductase